MAFLTIAGTDFWVLDGGAEESTPEAIGQSRRAIDGSLRSGVFVSKRNYRFTLEPLTPAGYEVLAPIHETIATITGDAVVDGDYLVTVEHGTFERTSDTAYKRGPTIALRQA